VHGPSAALAHDVEHARDAHARRVPVRERRDFAARAAPVEEPRGPARMV